MTCCCCDRPAVQLHHVCYRQTLRREWTPTAQWPTLRVLTDDPRNLVPVAHDCHGAHHNRSRPLMLNVLPDEAFVFARELLGAGPAFEYLRRRYAGEDQRLDDLLDGWKVAA